MSQSPDGFPSLEAVAEAIASYQLYRSRPATLAGLAKNVRLGSDGRYRWHWDRRFRTARGDLTERRRPLEACARHLELSTLLVRGAQSDVLSEDGARQFLGLCPTAELANVQGAAHMVAGDRNDVFLGAVLDFLTRAVPSAN